MSSPLAMQVLHIAGQPLHGLESALVTQFPLGLSSTREKLIDMQKIIDQIDAQIAQLQMVRTLLADTAAPIRRKPGRPSGSGKALPPAKVNAVGLEKVAGKPSPVRTLSAEARQRMATAQRARWAKSKAASKKAVKEPVRKAEVTAVAKPTKPKTAAPKTAPLKKATSVKKAGVRKGETAPVAAV